MLDKVEALLRGLEQDRDNILQGNIQAVLHSSAQRERQFATIGDGHQVELPKLLRIKAQALANSRLLRAAIEGMQAARLRFSKRGLNAPSLRTYSREGAERKLGPRSGGLEIRA